MRGLPLQLVVCANTEGVLKSRYGTGFFFEQLRGKKEYPNGAREQEGRVGEQQGLRCGDHSEANPNQGLGGTACQKPNAVLKHRDKNERVGERWLREG